MRNYVQPGERVTITAPSGGTTSGIGILVGTHLFGVALTTGAQNDSVEILTEGIHSGDASGLVTILRAYFGQQVELEQFVGHWMRLPPEVVSRLGAPDGSSRIGQSCVLGSRVWDCQNKFRIVIGPLDYAAYRRFLPGGASMRALTAWVHTYAGMALEWDVRLLLKKEEVPPMRLGGATVPADLLVDGVASVVLKHQASSGGKFWI